MEKNKNCMMSLTCGILKKVKLIETGRRMTTTRDWRLGGQAGMGRWWSKGTNLQI